MKILSDEKKRAINIHPPYTNVQHLYLVNDIRFITSSTPPILLFYILLVVFCVFIISHQLTEQESVLFFLHNICMCASKLTENDNNTESCKNNNEI